MPAPLGDSHLRTVTDAIIAQVGGLNRLEEDVFASARTACGLRPGLALRIAPAFAFDSDRKPIGVRKSGRQGGSELSRWIARHLADDGLTAGEGGDPDRVGLAAGAAMAMMVAPQPRKRVQRAVGHLFQHAGSPEKADALVGLLVSRGWLEEHDGSAHPLHPVIADEMLARALLAPDGEALSTTAEWIFQAALDDPVSARRLIDGIRRLVDAYPHEGLKSLLKAKCHDWVEQHGRAIGVLAVAFEAQRGDEVGLIPAMLEGPPWYAIASDHLKTLSHQYLSSETDPAVGRSRLEASLAALPKPAQIPADWRTLAADLLSGDLGAPDGPLLAAALGRRSPDQQWARQVRDTAIRWTEDHTDAAAPVLGALIRDRSLPKPDLHLVVERALDWISRHDGPGGTRVLAPLIINKKLTPRQRDDVLSAARDWLRRNSRTEDAKFVLRALLKDPVRRENHFREALPFAFEWLEANGDSSASWSVASHVCNRDAVAAWLPHLLPWLETHAIEPVIRSVLVRTLQIRSKHLELDEERKMVRCGVAWLRANPDDWAVPEVCGALAGHARRPGLEGKQRKYRQNQAVTSEQADEVLISVSRWIGGFGSRNINTSVVLALLGYYHAGREPTVQFSRDALDWLGHPRPVDDARKVLSLLVRRGAFDEESADEAAERVAKELESFPEFVKDTRLQAGIFRLFKKFPGAVRAPVREAFAAAAIGVAEDDDGAAEPPSIPPFDVLQHLLHIGGFEPGRRRQICLSGLRWLESNSAQDDADKIIRRLLDEPGWRGAEIQSLIDHAFEWLHRWIDAGKASPDHEGPSNVLSRLVRRPELRRADVMTALEMAERWMSGKGKRKWAAHRRIAEAFLERQDLTPDEEARYLSILLRTARSSTEWREQLLQALERGLVWLRDHADLPTASNVIGPALWRARDQGELEWDRTAVFAAAERWLRRYQRLGRAHYVLKPLLLLDREAALPDDFQNLVPFTLAYLESHAEDWYAREVFRLVCRREDLSDAQRTALVDIARVWLENRSADPEASHVLQALVRLSLTDAQLEFVLEASLAWATNMLDIIERRYESGVTKLEYHRKYEPRYLLAKLLAREGLTEAGHSRVLGVALRTHRVKPLNTEPFDWELEPDSERVAGDEPLLRHAIEHLDGMDEVVEIGPVLAEAHAFRLPAETWTAVRERSLRWLEIHASAETAGEVYFQLARTMGVSSFRASRVLPRALAWLEIHGGKRSTRTLLWSLLRRELTADQVADLLPFAEPELTDFSLTTAQSRLLASVIAQPHTPAEVAEPLVRTAIEALEYDDGRGDAARWALIDGLTRCRHLNPAQRRRVIAFVVQWGGRPKTERRAAKLFNRCLDMEGLSGAEREQLLGAVVAWADTRAMDFTAWPVIAGIGAFLEREGAVGDGRARRVEKLILTAAGQAATNPEGGVLFADVVSLRWCGDEAQRTLLSGALEWFGEHYLKSRAGAVALALWPLGLKSAERRRLVQLAALWIQEHSSAPQANELVDAIRTSAMYASLPFRTRGILDEIHARTDDASLDPSEDDADEEAWGVV
ncbi:hypothetical protein [Glycomyces tenuis]|uniref:hypothetical protein n=1 Tax=Glycomyces tenuis TaxID=58116 RepID=UPI000A401F68|nr:hypothetical protein [Glycomyces tenuis]